MSRASPAAAAGRVLGTLYLFIRFPVVNFSLMLPLLGAATTGPAFSFATVPGLLAVALAFHCYAYVLNDVVDLELDRGEPLRRDYPLVRGTIGCGPALAFALLQPPLALAVSAWLAVPMAAHAVLLAGFALMGIYDLWGKRCPLPPLTDALQGLGWAALVVYGTLATGTPSTATAALAGMVLVVVLMINGVHGALRDLANDLAGGARTTAILLGARPCGAEGMFLPRMLIGYALSLQALYCAIGLLTGALANPTLSPFAFGAALMLVLNAGCLALLWRAWRAAADRWNMIRFGIWHLALLLLGLILPFAANLPASALVLLLAVFALPLLAMWLRYGFQWG